MQLNVNRTNLTVQFYEDPWFLKICFHLAPASTLLLKQGWPLLVNALYPAQFPWELVLQLESGIYLVGGIEDNFNSVQNINHKQF